MERNYMRAGSLVELDFITERHTGLHWHENFELLFVISGSLSITVEEDTYQLNSGDLIVVNVNRKHSYNGTEDLVLGRFSISDVKVRELLGLDHVLFWCNSAADRNEAYEELRRVIAKIFNQVMQENGRSRLYLSSMYYQLLHILAENFTLAPGDKRYEADRGKSDDRIQEIFAYIRANYRQNVTLDDIAQHLYLSPTYVSKYIKQKCSINFMELLNSVRLSHAMEDLMYTEDSIMKIALENGFASVAAYNKAFKDTYHITPSEFRKQRKSGSKQENEEEKQRKALIEQRVEAYLEHNPSHPDSSTEQVSLDAGLDMNAPACGEWNRCSCRMINAGTAADLLNATFQVQILSWQEQLGFEYVRFWDIYDPELYIDIHAAPGTQNFSRLNAVTDFLVSHRLKPYIELGFKSRRILRTVDKVIKDIQRNADFLSEEEEKAFYSELFWHFVKRYGSWEVKSWYFEFWEYRYVDNRHQYLALTEPQHRSYLHHFSVVAQALRRYLPDARIGGGGFPVRFYGEDGFAQILSLWKQEPEQPDFISLSCFPYQREMEKGVYYDKRSSDLNFVRYNIEMAQGAMEKADFPSVPIHVTEYSLSLSNRNALNDSCMKGAFMLSNTFSCLDQAEILGHWLFTDAHADEQDSGMTLFGGCGMLTRDGIPKPSCYAVEFLHRLYVTIQKLHPNYMVTRNDRGSMRMVCHNLKKPSYSYYMTEEDELDIKSIPGILDNREFLTIHFRANGVEDGTYTVKASRINSHHGSVQDKWIDLNMEPDLTKRELDYLRMISISELSIREVEAQNHCLAFDIDLEPNEIRYIHIFQK
ncbi:MAG: helix-turn-helix domain-containing protein [Candidatus Onthomonas sp.]